MNNEKEKNQINISEKNSNPYNPEEEVYDVINSTLKDLAPKPNKSESTILVYEKLLVADKSLIDDFIDKGGNELLLKIDRNKKVSKSISPKRVNDYNNIKILHTYPLVTSEFKKHIGGVIYSRIIFNDDKTKASFIFNFERLHVRKTKILCAVDVAKKNGDWVILSKTCLDNHPGMLFE